MAIQLFAMNKSYCQLNRGENKLFLQFKLLGAWSIKASSENAKVVIEKLHIVYSIKGQSSTMHLWVIELIPLMWTVDIECSTSMCLMCTVYVMHKYRSKNTENLGPRWISCNIRSSKKLGNHDKLEKTSKDDKWHKADTNYANLFTPLHSQASMYESSNNTFIMHVQ